jgi:hypothetical protein
LDKIHLELSDWWFGTFLFPYILRIIIPTDFHLFSEGLKPPTRILMVVFEGLAQPTLPKVG